ncbi:MAG: fatty acid desaturase [Panacagrimonas sp.]|jgi:omega-6 fatty acid desaturase (delta-12 desaturase)|nr:fatty acid desaturase [Panacagrimonas sp.]MCC2658611.1 fatty acid desaturase [Panacagrimonas sp.]
MRPKEDFDPAAAVLAIKQRKRRIVDRYARPDDFMGWIQSLATLVPLSGLWLVVAIGAPSSPGLVALATVVMALFLLRVFALMHECGHRSLFRSARLNSIFGFVFGVICGMPQYVWAAHHKVHHATNGNWDRYRGPLAILSVEEFDALTSPQQRAYARARNVRMAPLAGFLYVVLNPRLTWVEGTAKMLAHAVRMKWRRPAVPMRDHLASYRSPHWKSAAEYRHMTLNNLVLLGGWASMAWLIGPATFFLVYLISTSLAGAAGIVLFTVQHNFEHSYASGDEHWDYDQAALHGTSFLVLPAWLNWFTANIGYHHIHHLSSRIPSHRLAACHEEHATLFEQVPRLTLGDIGASLKFVLWDTRSRQLISVAEHAQMARPA